MSRPLKKGIDYFSLDVYNDDKLKLLIAEFGMIGFGVVISFFQKIYAEEGYYAVLNDDVVKLFALEKNVGYSTVSEIIHACLRVGIFDRSMYESHFVLTSKGIQRRYLAAASRRLECHIEKQYSLLTIPKKRNGVDNNHVNVNRNPVNVNRSTQSKVKESKVDKSKEKECICAFADFWNCYPRKVKKMEAEKIFRRMNPSAELFKKLLTQLELQKRTNEWKDLTYIPYPSTWLNQCRWEDEVTITQERGGKQYAENRSKDANGYAVDRYGHRVL